MATLGIHGSLEGVSIASQWGLNRFLLEEAMGRILSLFGGLWRFISRSDQIVFAESFGQALALEMETSDAIGLTADVIPSRRFRIALLEMRKLVRSGYTLEQSLAKTGVRGASGLRAALQAGEEGGCLVEELYAFARRSRASPQRVLRRKLGRSSEAERFAAALARLLQNRSLTLDRVEDAGRIAAEGNRSFSKAMQEIREDMESGTSLAESLTRQPRFFDKLFCRLVEASETRDQLRLCLARLGAE